MDDETMAILLKEYPNDLVFHARVTCEDPIPASIFMELEKALDALRSRLDSGYRDYLAVSVQVTGAPDDSFYSDRIPEAITGEFNPYIEFSRAFWDIALADTSMRPQLIEFLNKIEDFSSYATRADGGIWYLSEDDIVMFCQPIFFYLAKQDIAFVPNYTRMLSHWRTAESSSWCEQDLAEMLESYGIVHETKALIENYIANEGPSAEEFQELLDNSNIGDRFEYR